MGPPMTKLPIVRFVRRFDWTLTRPASRRGNRCAAFTRRKTTALYRCTDVVSRNSFFVAGEKALGRPEITS